MTMIAFRAQVLLNLTAALKAIKPANGYITDIADRAFFGRAVYGANDLLPMLSAIEDPRERNSLEGDPGSSATKRDWKLLIQGFVDDDPENPTLHAYNLAADVLRCVSRLRNEDIRNVLGLGYKSPAVTKISIGDPIVRPADDYSEKAYCWIPLILELSEDSENPYLPNP